MIGPDGGRHPAYLHTSPEFAMKKLLAAGERRIFALTRVFRNRERGALHAPEFTMLEWYRAEAPLDALMADCVSVLALAAEAAGSSRFRFRDREADPLAPAERLTLRDAFRLHAGDRPLRLAARRRPRRARPRAVRPSGGRDRRAGRARR